MKILICSDNHGDQNVLLEMVNKHNDCDYYWHLGDSEFFDINDLYPFISVKGNNDYLDLPISRIINLKEHNFLLIHGTGLTYYGYDELIKLTKKKNCDVLVFGHTHIPYDDVIDDIKVINPGSCYHNRNLSKPSYIIMNIDEEGNIENNFYEI